VTAVHFSGIHCHITKSSGGKRRPVLVFARQN